MRASLNISLDEERLKRLTQLLSHVSVPKEAESSDHGEAWSLGQLELANAYFAIVAICHQTSPIGERRLEGVVSSGAKYGWNYLKERFLERAIRQPDWTKPAFWARVSPKTLSQLYADDGYGLTLNRVNERAYLLNDIGARLVEERFTHLHEAFLRCNSTLGGDTGFLEYLRGFEAYSDPVRKKAAFFTSIAVTQCDWKASDFDCLESPVDYHELRGHLRLGTVRILDQYLESKVRMGLTLTGAEDIELRRVVQRANSFIATNAKLTASVVHYLFWNVFRYCCPRESDQTHCTSCGPNCKLPRQYKDMTIYKSRCLFSDVCESAGASDKVTEPAYMGHYY